MFQILDTSIPDFNPDSDVNKQMSQQLKQLVVDDVITQYVRVLEKDYGVRISESRAAQRHRRRRTSDASNPPSTFSHAPMRAASAQLVATRLVADLETPVSAFLKLSRGTRRQRVPARIGRRRRRRAAAIR